MDPDSTKRFNILQTKAAKKLETLHNYINKGNLEGVKILLEKEKIDVETSRPPCGTFLHRAVNYGRLDIVKYLLSKGASVDCLLEKFTPLAFAAENGDVEMAWLLIQNGADINFEAEDNDFLQLAILSDEPPIIEFALNHGFDIDRLDREGLTPLAKAMFNLKYKSLKYLLETGANYRKLVEHQGTKQISLISCMKSLKSIDILLNHIEQKEGKQAMIEYINHADEKRGMTVLHYACGWQQEEVVRKLIQFGANSQQSDSKGMKPVDFNVIMSKSLRSQRIKSMLEADQQKTTK